MSHNPMALLSDRPGASATRLFPEEVDALLEQLCASGWQRLPEGFGDPLDMLFGHRFRQWTMGWDPITPDLWLLIWETDSWREKPLWNLYRNGTLAFQEETGFSRRSKRFDVLLESPRLPFIGHQRFLSTLTDFLNPQAFRDSAGQALADTLLARPEIVPSLRESLFQRLEADLGNPEWPTLDVLKLHRLSQRIPLVKLFLHLAENGLLKRTADRIRLGKALEACREEFHLQAGRLSSLMEADFLAARQRFDDEASRFHPVPSADLADCH